MTTADAALTHLKRRRPEWTPWLSVVEEVVRETDNPRWDAAVPPSPGSGAVPLLAGAAIDLPSAASRFFERLIREAATNGTDKLASLESAVQHADVFALFKASICQDHETLAEIAVSSGSDPEALQAVAAVMTVPFLQACNRRWAASIPQGWIEGYCPVCAAWPAFAEVRGIERSRYFRCGRCGADWHSRMLHCGYCGNHSHEELVSLVPDAAGSTGAVDACRRCRGYVKTFTRLQGCAPGAVMLEDLGSVDLDVAALELEYTRPVGGGCRFDVAVKGLAPARRFFAWNA